MCEEIKWEYVYEYESSSVDIRDKLKVRNLEYAIPCLHRIQWQWYVYIFVWIKMCVSVYEYMCECNDKGFTVEKRNTKLEFRMCNLMSSPNALTKVCVYICMNGNVYACLGKSVCECEREYVCMCIWFVCIYERIYMNVSDSMCAICIYVHV